MRKSRVYELNTANEGLLDVLFGTDLWLEIRSTFCVLEYIFPLYYSWEYKIYLLPDFDLALDAYVETKDYNIAEKEVMNNLDKQSEGIKPRYQKGMSILKKGYNSYNKYNGVFAINLGKVKTYFQLRQAYDKHYGWPNLLGLYAGRHWLGNKPYLSEDYFENGVKNFIYNNRIKDMSKEELLSVDKRIYNMFMNKYAPIVIDYIKPYIEFEDRMENDMQIYLYRSSTKPTPNTYKQVNLSRISTVLECFREPYKFKISQYENVKLPV